MHIIDFFPLANDNNSMTVKGNYLTFCRMPINLHYHAILLIIINFS